MCIQKVRQLVPEISLDEIASAVSKVYLVSMKRLLGDYNEKRTIEAREMCVYIMCIKTTASKRSISAYFNNLPYKRVWRVYSKIKKNIGLKDSHYERLSRVLAKTG